MHLVRWFLVQLLKVIMAPCHENSLAEDVFPRRAGVSSLSDLVADANVSSTVYLNAGMKTEEGGERSQREEQGRVRREKSHVDSPWPN